MNSNSDNYYLIISLNDQTEFKIDNKTTKCKICEKNLLGIKIDKEQTFNMHVPDWCKKLVGTCMYWRQLQLDSYS